MKPQGKDTFSQVRRTLISREWRESCCSFFSPLRAWRSTPVQPRTCSRSCPSFLKTQRGRGSSLSKFPFSNTWPKVNGILRKYSSSQGHQSPGFSAEGYRLLFDHLTLTKSRHLGGKRVLGNEYFREGGAYENKPEEQVSSRARPWLYFVTVSRRPSLCNWNTRESTAQAPS